MSGQGGQRCSGIKYEKKWRRIECEWTLTFLLWIKKSSLWMMNSGPSYSYTLSSLPLRPPTLPLFSVPQARLHLFLPELDATDSLLVLLPGSVTDSFPDISNNNLPPLPSHSNK